MSTGDKSDALETLLARIRKTAAARAAKEAEARAMSERADAAPGPSAEQPDATVAPPNVDGRRADEAFEEIRLDDRDVQFEEVRQAFERAAPVAATPVENGAPAGPAHGADEPIDLDLPPGMSPNVHEAHDVASCDGRPELPVADSDPEQRRDETRPVGAQPLSDPDGGFDQLPASALGGAEEAPSATDFDAQATTDVNAGVDDAPPASTRQPRDELRDRDETEPLVDADAFVELVVDDEVPPASGEVSSQRFSTSHGSGDDSAVGVEPPEPLNVRLLPDAPPRAAERERPLGPMPPVVVDVSADVAAYRPMTHDPAIFLGAVRKPRPRSFGALLDDAMTLGS